jgi:hypothetical protein
VKEITQKSGRRGEEGDQKKTNKEEEGVEGKPPHLELTKHPQDHGRLGYNMCNKILSLCKEGCTHSLYFIKGRPLHQPPTSIHPLQNQLM